MKKTLKGYGKLTLAIIIGNLLIALDVAIFVGPTGIIMGGATGIALAMRHFFGLDTAIGVLAVNVIFLAIGTYALGKKFLFSSVASSLIYPVLLSLVQQLPLASLTTEDHLLAALVGGALLGTGVGIVVRNGAGTGGTDGLAMALNAWTHISTAVWIPIVDTLILLLQAFFSNFNQILYGIVLTVVSSFVLNKVILLGRPQLQLFVVSDRYKKLRQEILGRLNMGATMVKIETGIAGKQQEGLLTVIHPRALFEVTEAIQRIDPNAFITVIQVKEVRGQGFTKDRINYTNSRSCRDDS